MLEHGGRLLQAARRHRIPVSQWLDLSTGINPAGWPVPFIPSRVWQRLPEDDDGLVELACAYYGAPEVLPVAGSQAAIQGLPRLRGSSRVGVLAPGYAEHAHSWRQAGHAVGILSAAELFAQAGRFDVIVLIHPNNPAGDRFGRDELLGLHASLATRGGWLVVDEAFMDAEPEQSLCDQTGRPGLIVLRSVGKFFGLAGARAGFVCAARELLDRLRGVLGPWTLTGPTRLILKQALADFDWHEQARIGLDQRSARLADMLTAHGLAPSGGCAFFHWRCDPLATVLHEALATRGILTRRFEVPVSLRFGLPLTDADFTRLDAALEELIPGLTAIAEPRA